MIRTHIFPCLLAAIAIIGAALSSPSVDMRAEAGQIDFTSLREQASSAMLRLQTSQERRMAMLQTGEF